jgi:hypothetical protein
MLTNAKRFEPSDSRRRQVHGLSAQNDLYTILHVLEDGGSAHPLRTMRLDGVDVPAGYIWHGAIGQGLDPDLRKAAAMRLLPHALIQR